MNRIAAWLAVIALGLVAHGHVIAFFKTFTLFAAAEGVVLLDGRPVKVSRFSRPTPGTGATRRPPL
jgi:hypothetical protein